MSTILATFYGRFSFSSARQSQVSQTIPAGQFGHFCTLFIYIYFCADAGRKFIILYKEKQILWGSRPENAPGFAVAASFA